MRDVIAGVHELLAPRRCLACRRRGGSALWCRWCASELRTLEDPCRRCAAPAAGPHVCWPAASPVDGMVAMYDYRGPLASALRTAKLEGLAHVWPRLAGDLAQRVDDAFHDIDVVTWVTTPARRVRERGADHAERLARCLSGELELPCRRLLHATPAPAGDRYRARHPLPASTVLLVDDVVTTGATIWRAAEQLRAAGAGSVHVAVIARAGAHPLGAPRRRGRASPATSGSQLGGR